MTQVLIASQLATMVISGDEDDAREAWEWLDRWGCMEVNDSFAACLVRTGRAEQIESDLLN